MSDEDKEDKAPRESFLGWAWDLKFLGVLIVMALLMLGSAISIGIDSAASLTDQAKTAVTALALFTVGTFAVVLLISSINWLAVAARRNYVRGGMLYVMLSPVARAGRMIASAISGLFAAIYSLLIFVIIAGVGLAILAGIAGLLLFGIRQLV